MSKPKWYNWVGDPMWDDYCKYSLIFIIIPGMALLLFILIGVLTGFIKVVS